MSPNWSIAAVISLNEALDKVSVYNTIFCFAFQTFVCWSDWGFPDGAVAQQLTGLRKGGVAPTVLRLRPVPCLFVLGFFKDLSTGFVPSASAMCQTPPAGLMLRHSISLQWLTKHFLVPKTRLWELLTSSPGVFFYLIFILKFLNSLAEL